MGVLNFNVSIPSNSPVEMWRPRPRPGGDPLNYPDDKKTLKVDAFEIEKKWILDR